MKYPQYMIKLGTLPQQLLTVRYPSNVVAVGERCEVQELENGPWVPCVITDIRLGVVFVDRM